MDIFFDSMKEEYKKPFGTVRENEKINLKLKISRRYAVINLYVVFYNLENNETFSFPFCWYNLDDSGFDLYKCDFKIENKGIYEYFFKTETPYGEISLYRDSLKGVTKNKGRKWQLTVTEKDFETPKRFMGRIIYQIFPDRFYYEKIIGQDKKIKPFVIKNKDEIPEYKPDNKGEILNNDFYGGNFSGVIKKLPYLKDLGIECIYFNPIFFAYSNHRYDTADYEICDPMLGTNEDFKKLCSECHKNDILVILDGVFSHTGSRSKYFDKDDYFKGGAYNNPCSIYRSWYNIDENKKYDSWWGIETLPQVNELNPSYCNYIMKICKKWMTLGADGLRLDVADELPDGFIKILRKNLKEIDKSLILIGEVWEDASNKISYGKRREYFLGDELDSVMNYPLRDAIISFLLKKISAYEFKDRMMTLYENYPKCVSDTLMNSLSTHDTVRILNILGEVSCKNRDEEANYKINEETLKTAISRLKKAVEILFFMPGCPTIYYGDEIGMEGFSDPFNRGFFKWDMVNENNKILNFFKKVIKKRKNNEVLRTGKLNIIPLSDTKILIERFNESKKLSLEISSED